MNPLHYADQTLWQRRSFLQAGAVSALGLSLPEMLLANSASHGSRLHGTAKACILLFMTGGPAQQETFDPKPDAPEGTRGEFKPTATSVNGIQISEHLPKMAKLVHHCAIFGGEGHGSDTHGVGVHFLQ